MTKEKPIAMVPSLTATLMSLEPGDYVHCGKHWTHGTIRQTASNLGISIATKRGDAGITVMRALEIPEPK